MKFRAYNRVNFTNPLKSYVSICNVYGHPVQTKRSLVQIHDISQGGLSFSTPLNFRTNEIELLFNLQILGKNTNIKGTIIWQKQDSTGLYHYGVRLTKFNVQFYQILDQLTPQRKILA